MLDPKDTRTLENMIKANGILDVLQAIQLHAFSRIGKGRSSKSKCWELIYAAIGDARRIAMDAIEESRPE